MRKEIGRDRGKSHNLGKYKSSLLEGRLAHVSIFTPSSYKFIHGVILFLSNRFSIFFKRPFALPFFYLLKLSYSSEFKAKVLLVFP